MNYLDDLHFSSSVDRLLGQARAEVFHYPAVFHVGPPILNNQVDLEEGFNKLHWAASQAIHFLNSPATFSLSPGMEDVVRSALSILDNSVILTEYLITPKNGLSKELIALVLSIGYMATKEGAVPFHRLIPLNSWRRNYRDHLPEDTQHLFPWYDVWSEEDDLLLEEFVTNLPNLKSDDFSCYADSAAARYHALFMDIQRDTPFLAHLEKSYRLLQLSVEAIGGDIATRLFCFAESFEPTMALPGPVLKVGFHTAASAALLAATPDTEEERHELLLLGAVAGPDLEDEDRLAIFKKVASFVNETTDLNAGGFLKKVKSWAEYRLTEREIGDAAYNHWFDMLEQAAPQVATPFSYKEGQFLQAIEIVRNMVIPDRENQSVPISFPSFPYDLRDRLSEKAKTFWSEFLQSISPMPANCTMQPAFAMMMGQVYSCVLTHQPIPFSGDRLRQAVLPSNGHLMKAEAAKDLRSLLKNYHLFYVGCTIDHATGAISPLKDVAQKLTITTSVVVEEGKLLLVGIGSDMDCLTKAMQELTRLDGIKAPSKLDHIVWIAYAPEEK